MTVIASASRKETVEFVEKAGADFIVNHRNSLKEEFEKIGVKDVDYVLHAHEFNNKYCKELAEVLKPYGVLGIISAEENINLGPLFSKCITLVHEMRNARPLMGVDLEVHGKILDKMAENLDSGLLFSTATEISKFSVENIQKGHEKLEGGSVIGKLVFEGVEKFEEEAQGK